MTQTILAKSTWNTLRFLNAIKRDTLLWVNMECRIWKRWFTLPPSPSDNVGTPLQHNETYCFWATLHGGAGGIYLHPNALKCSKTFGQDCLSQLQNLSSNFAFCSIFQKLQKIWTPNFQDSLYVNIPLFKRNSIKNDLQ